MIEGLLALAGRLRAARHAVMGPSWTALVLAGLVLATFAAAQLARIGTAQARSLAGVGLASVVVLFVVVAVIERLRWRDARAAVARVVAIDDPALGASIDRAAGLALRSAAPATDAEAEDPFTRRLAEVHLARQLGRVRMDGVTHRAASRSRYVAALAFAAAATSLGVAAIDPFRILEGLDVLAARAGRAPLDLLYLDSVDIVATPPSYIGAHEVALSRLGNTAQPRGTMITVRGKAQRAGRQIVLTDGVDEIPFVEDGTGMMLARWTVGDTTRLRVAARFGDVRVFQSDTLTVESIADAPPQVKLERAPRTVKLVDNPSVSLEYKAEDDHGLREIALVLRAGGKEERRTLSRPTGRVERGANELSTREPFFKKSYLPVEVMIEAKDNDAVLGPKWGRSAPFVIVPPLVGEPEALRYAALLRARGALVDLVAERVTTDVGTTADAKARLSREIEIQKTAVDVVEDVLAQTYGGLRCSGRLRRVVAGQLRRLGTGLDVFEAAPSAEEYKKLTTTTEDVVLAVDSAIRGLGVDDSRKVSKRLADVADEAADASRAALDPMQSDRSGPRLDAALEVLKGGGAHLATLGELGADLGDIARGGVGRIDRERKHPDFRGAELAALDIADRLRNPFSSVAGGGRPGVESGVGDGSPTDDGEASEADGEADQGGRELEELIQRHAEEMQKVDEAMDRAMSAEDRQALRKLAKEQADAIREAVKELPQRGVPGSASQKAAEGRRSAESMAGELEKGDVKEAIAAGKEALEALREATKLGEKGRYFDDEDVGNASKAAGNRVEEAIEDLQKKLDSVNDNAREKAESELRESGKNEGRMADRSKDLHRRGEKGDASMPQEMLDKLEEAEQAMRDAQRELERGDSESGRERQREAQRLLEMARGEEGEDGEGQKEKGQNDGVDGPQLDQDAEVPGSDKHKGPEAFRKRVLEGLGRPSDARLKDAVKRYAEGLVK